jgi:hypothetical protein
MWFRAKEPMLRDIVPAIRRAYRAFATTADRLQSRLELT